MVLIAILCWILFFRKTGIPNGPTEEAGVSFSQVQLVGNKAGERQWEIVSKYLKQDGELFHLTELDYLLLLEDSQPKYFVEAANGTWDRSANKLKLSKDVVVDDHQGFRLLTESLIWYTGNESFDFHGKTLVTFSKGGEADE